MTHLEWIKSFDPTQQRCCDCAYLIEGYHGEWVCEVCGLEIHEISDPDCFDNQD